MRRTFWTLSFLIFLGCGSGERLGENYGDLTGAPSGLILTQEYHGDGWGRADCLLCHPIQNIHLANRTSLPGIDMEEVRYRTVRDGEAGCSQCHGANGATGGTAVYRTGVR
jgi:hypothetical protein